MHFLRLGKRCKDNSNMSVKLSKDLNQYVSLLRSGGSALQVLVESDIDRLACNSRIIAGSSEGICREGAIQ